jgi:hypothetical protein
MTNSAFSTQVMALAICLKLMSISFQTYQIAGMKQLLLGVDEKNAVIEKIPSAPCRFKQSLVVRKDRDFPDVLAAISDDPPVVPDRQFPVSHFQTVTAFFSECMLHVAVLFLPQLGYGFQFEHVKQSQTHRAPFRADFPSMNPRGDKRAISLYTGNWTITCKY